MDICKLLIEERNAKIDCVDPYDTTPLMNVCKRKDKFVSGKYSLQFHYCFNIYLCMYKCNYTCIYIDTYIYYYYI